jgi:hypothetical protein
MDLDYADEIGNYPTWIAELDQTLVGGIYLQLVETSATTGVCRLQKPKRRA